MLFINSENIAMVIDLASPVIQDSEAQTHIFCALTNISVGWGVSYPRIWEQWHSLCMFSLVQLRTAAGAVNCLRWQCCDIHYLFLPPSGKALPAEVQCLLHNDHAPVPKARIWEVPH